MGGHMCESSLCTDSRGQQDIDSQVFLVTVVVHSATANVFAVNVNSKLKCKFSTNKLFYKLSSTMTV